MRRLLLTLRYDGTHYHGWQVQPGVVTVQQVLQDAIQSVTGVRAGVIGCSRTDSGVHANMFCCTFDTESAVPIERMPLALNQHLPSDVAVYRCEEVALDFHPRYLAQGKRYCYHIWNDPCRNPFWDRYALRRTGRLNEQLLNRAAAAFVGTHDFAAFCAAGADTAAEDTVRTVSKAEVKRDGKLVTFTVEADGFLYNMVRIMVGTLLDIAAGALPPDAIETALETGRREDAGFTAPALGLFLEKVYYEEGKTDAEKTSS